MIIYGLLKLEFFLPDIHQLITNANYCSFKRYHILAKLQNGHNILQVVDPDLFLLVRTVPLQSICE